MFIRLRPLAISLAILLSFSQCSTLENLFNEAATPSSCTPSRTPRHSEENQLRQNIVDFALKQQGAPYKYAGRSPRTGFDCSGFTYYVMSNFGIELTPVSRIQEDEGQRIRLEEAKPGDLVFFRRSRTGSVFHVALVVSNGNDGMRVIHSTSSRGVIVDNIQESSYWRKKIATARRVIPQ
ncbi:MAG: NlpC/P60 family protein [Bacteroidetes bacterium]|nr:MAG: NlpC/P60 family protein [Bacteroidota bacterium]